jgi:hypothetical protein
VAKQPKDDYSTAQRVFEKYYPEAWADVQATSTVVESRQRSKSKTSKVQQHAGSIHRTATVVDPAPVVHKQVA